MTLQQQVNESITFTYTQDLTQTNSQIIRVEWAMTPRFSAVATRDENGVFGLDLLYKKQFREPNVQRHQGCRPAAAREFPRLRPWK